MSHSATSYRRVAPGRKDRFEYLQIYSICFALCLLPVAIRRLVRPPSGKAGEYNSIFKETRRLAANYAAMSFAGL